MRVRDAVMRFTRPEMMTLINAPVLGARHPVPGLEPFSTVVIAPLAPRRRRFGQDGSQHDAPEIKSRDKQRTGESKGKRAALTKIKSQIYTWPTTDWLYEFNILADTGGKGGASHQPFICPRL